ncbi:NAD(P)-dependent oxidoreductase [Frondihabitans sp. PAMC 28766]|uniref:NmrA family NAD(P)-binding protein n=1 Tax=Frondihabitans sp. PAMC 28766 TaxID=1795630 RepID=UPI00078C1AC7|nr:NAD(P)H-binding protein [Frondihabitans sp. PAMC 28766]AMM22108.1 NAD(P)-dependent oxidoreductase [Frondihabitans sp. PAMC 28766]
MIIVTGATGALNGATVDHLLERLPPSEITVVARDAAKAQRFADRGVAVRVGGDYSDTASLPRAFEGADQLLLVSSNDPGADAVSLHGAAIDAAKSVGVGRILYTSHQGATVGSPFFPADIHARTEQLLADSGVAWTSMRNGFYLHSLTWLAGPWRETGVITVPGEGKVSWTAREDAAQAAAAILLSDGEYDGPTTITASAAVTFDEVAAIASDLTGRTIGFSRVSEDEWVAGEIASGQAEQTARFLLGFYQATDQGLFAGTDPLLATLLGHEPRTVRDFLAEPPAPSAW